MSLEGFRSGYLLAALLLLLLLVVSLAASEGFAAAPGVGDDSGLGDDGVWEVGALWVNRYSSSCCDCRAASLECCDDGANKLIGVLVGNGFVQRFNLGDCNAWRLHIVDSSLGGLDSYYADSVDLLLFSGHGSSGGLLFCVGCNADPYSIRLGDGDLEWAVFDACEVLSTVAVNPATSPWRNIFHGLHAVLGFNTSVPDPDLRCFLGVCIPVCGRREELFAAYLTRGYDVVNAWRRATIEAIRSQEVWAGGYGPWDPATQGFGLYDAPYANPPVMSRDVVDPDFFMAVFWRCG